MGGSGCMVGHLMSYGPALCEISATGAIASKMALLQNLRDVQWDCPIRACQELYTISFPLQIPLKP